jgi:hypothetical protein
MHFLRAMFDERHLPFAHHGPGRVTRGALMAAVAVLLLAVSAALTSRSQDWKRPQPNPALARQAEALDRRIAAEQPAAVERAHALSAADLARDYRRDQAGADRRYLGHQLLVSGMVRSVEREQRYDVLVRLRGAGAGSTVRATLAEWEGPRAAALHRGDRVKLLCTGGGKILQSPSLRGCIIR